MRSRHLLAALVLSLVSAAPISAQLVVGSDRAASANIAGPRDPRTPESGFFSARSGVHVARDAYVVEDGSADVRQGIVGSIPLADNASVGLGVYKVSRYSRGDPSFTKLRPMEDVYGRHQRIAAVGLSLHF